MHTSMVHGTTYRATWNTYSSTSISMAQTCIQVLHNTDKGKRHVNTVDDPESLLGEPEMTYPRAAGVESSGKGLGNGSTVAMMINGSRK